MRSWTLLAALLFLLTTTVGRAQEAAVETPEPAAEVATEAEVAVESAPAAEAESTAAEPEAAAEEAPVEIEVPAEEEPNDAGDGEAAEEPAEEDGEAPEPAESIDWAGLIERFPALGAVFHRAAVHLPIALWLLGALFVLVGVVAPSWRNQIPLVCLFGGTLTAIASSLTGWWVAEYEWADEWAFSDLTDEDRFAEAIVQHRWMAVALVVASLVLSVIAIISQRKKSKGLGFVWRVGLLALAAAVGFEGHLGGEMTVGEGYVEEAVEAWINPDGE